MPNRTSIIIGTACRCSRHAAGACLRDGVGTPQTPSTRLVEATYVAPVARLLLAWLAVFCVGTSPRPRHAIDATSCPPDGARVAARGWPRDSRDS